MKPTENSEQTTSDTPSSQYLTPSETVLGAKDLLSSSVGNKVSGLLANEHVFVRCFSKYISYVVNIGSDYAVKAAAGDDIPSLKNALTEVAASEMVDHGINLLFGPWGLVINTALLAGKTLEPFADGILEKTNEDFSKAAKDMGWLAAYGPLGPGSNLEEYSAPWGCAGVEGATAVKGCAFIYDKKEKTIQVVADIIRNNSASQCYSLGQLEQDQAGLLIPHFTMIDNQQDQLQDRIKLTDTSVEPKFTLSENDKVAFQNRSESQLHQSVYQSVEYYLSSNKIATTVNMDNQLHQQMLCVGLVLRDNTPNQACVKNLSEEEKKFLTIGLLHNKEIPLQGITGLGQQAFWKKDGQMYFGDIENSIFVKTPSVNLAKHTTVYIGNLLQAQKNIEDLGGKQANGDLHLLSREEFLNIFTNSSQSKNSEKILHDMIKRPESLILREGLHENNNILISADNIAEIVKGSISESNFHQVLNEPLAGVVEEGVVQVMSQCTAQSFSKEKQEAGNDIPMNEMKERILSCCEAKNKKLEQVVTQQTEKNWLDTAKKAEFAYREIAQTLIRQQHRQSEFNEKIDRLKNKVKRFNQQFSLNLQFKELKQACETARGTAQCEQHLNFSFHTQIYPQLMRLEAEKFYRNYKKETSQLVKDGRESWRAAQTMNDKIVSVQKNQQEIIKNINEISRNEKISYTQTAAEFISAACQYSKDPLSICISSMAMTTLNLLGFCDSKNVDKLLKKNNKALEVNQTLLSYTAGLKDYYEGNYRYSIAKNDELFSTFLNVSDYLAPKELRKSLREQIALKETQVSDLEADIETAESNIKRIRNEDRHEELVKKQAKYHNDPAGYNKKYGEEWDTYQTRVKIEEKKKENAEKSIENTEKTIKKLEGYLDDEEAVADTRDYWHAQIESLYGDILPEDVAKFKELQAAFKGFTDYTKQLDSWLDPLNQPLRAMDNIVGQLGALAGRIDPQLYRVFNAMSLGPKISVHLLQVFRNAMLISSAAHMNKVMDLVRVVFVDFSKFMLNIANTVGMFVMPILGIASPILSIITALVNVIWPAPDPINQLSKTLQAGLEHLDKKLNIIFEQISKQINELAKEINVANENILQILNKLQYLTNLHRENSQITNNLIRLYAYHVITEILADAKMTEDAKQIEKFSYRSVKLLNTSLVPDLHFYNSLSLLDSIKFNSEDIISDFYSLHKSLLSASNKYYNAGKFNPSSNAPAIYKNRLHLLGYLKGFIEKNLSERSQNYALPSYELFLHVADISIAYLSYLYLRGDKAVNEKVIENSTLVNLELELNKMLHFLVEIKCDPIWLEGLVKEYFSHMIELKECVKSIFDIRKKNLQTAENKVSSKLAQLASKLTISSKILTQEEQREVRCRTKEKLTDNKWLPKPVKNGLSFRESVLKDMKNYKLFPEDIKWEGEKSLLYFSSANKINFLDIKYNKYDKFIKLFLDSNMIRATDSIAYFVDEKDANLRLGYYKNVLSAIKENEHLQKECIIVPHIVDIANQENSAPKFLPLILKDSIHLSSKSRFQNKIATHSSGPVNILPWKRTVLDDLERGLQQNLFTLQYRYRIKAIEKDRKMKYFITIITYVLIKGVNNQFVNRDLANQQDVPILTSENEIGIPIDEKTFHDSSIQADKIQIANAPVHLMAKKGKPIHGSSRRLIVTIELYRKNNSEDVFVLLSYPIENNQDLSNLTVGIRKHLAYEDINLSAYRCFDKHLANLTWPKAGESDSGINLSREFKELILSHCRYSINEYPTDVILGKIPLVYAPKLKFKKLYNYPFRMVYNYNEQKYTDDFLMKYNVTDNRLWQGMYLASFYLQRELSYSEYKTEILNCFESAKYEYPDEDSQFIYPLRALNAQSIKEMPLKFPRKYIEQLKKHPLIKKLYEASGYANMNTIICFECNALPSNNDPALTHYYEYSLELIFCSSINNGEYEPMLRLDIMSFVLPTNYTSKDIDHSAALYRFYDDPCDIGLIHGLMYGVSNLHLYKLFTSAFNQKHYIQEMPETGSSVFPISNVAFCGVFKLLEKLPTGKIYLDYNELNSGDFSKKVKNADLKALDMTMQSCYSKDILIGREPKYSSKLSECYELFFADRFIHSLEYNSLLNNTYYTYNAIMAWANLITGKKYADLSLWFDRYLGLINPAFLKARLHYDPVLLIKSLELLGPSELTKKETLLIRELLRNTDLKDTLLENALVKNSTFKLLHRAIKNNDASKDTEELANKIYEKARKNQTTFGCNEIKKRLQNENSESQNDADISSLESGSRLVENKYWMQRVAQGKNQYLLNSDHFYTVESDDNLVTLSSLYQNLLAGQAGSDKQNVLALLTEAYIFIGQDEKGRCFKSQYDTYLLSSNSLVFLIKLNVSTPWSINHLAFELQELQEGASGHYTKQIDFYTKMLVGYIREKSNGIIKPETLEILTPFQQLKVYLENLKGSVYKLLRQIERDSLLGIAKILALLTIEYSISFSDSDIETSLLNANSADFITMGNKKYFPDGAAPNLKGHLLFESLAFLQSTTYYIYKSHGRDLVLLYTTQDYSNSNVESLKKNLLIDPCGNCMFIVPAKNSFSLPKNPPVNISSRFFAKKEKTPRHFPSKRENAPVYSDTGQSFLTADDVAKFCRGNDNVVGEFVSVLTDGNCFFRAVLSAQGESPEGYAELRKNAIEYLRGHEADFVFPYYNELGFDEKFEEYLQRMSVDKEWADQPIIVATSRLLNLQINVMDLGFRINPQRTTESSNVGDVVEFDRTILLLRVNNNHYHAIHTPSNINVDVPAPNNFAQMRR